MKFYIYKMIHLPTGRVYIGQRKLPKGKTPETDEYFGSGKIWKRIYEKYPDECVKVIIDSAETGEKADELEKFYIAHYKSVWGDKCVNIARGGHNLHDFKPTEDTRKKIAAAKLGKKRGPHSEETKQKIAAANRGKKRGPCSEEQKEKLRLANKGKKRSAETRKKMSAARLGKHHSEETRKKLSAANRGKHLSDEHKEKIRLGGIGKKRSPETRKKIAAARLGKKRGPHSEEAKEKIRLANKGKKRSPETRKKLSEKAKQRWRKKKGLE